ncbi:adenosylcobinamide-GDP ribazoletransferase [Cellulosilyticum sp. ST5]|uniref:adenosylcobinamide-GDP ribazoletransferase n=1 Tax=unclassified Cellulosilyticum TaxID=2643091 RepID=UPI000F8D6D33|nr:adenosylcobinamide-GDP ribazoletransferase [Cellulosilyticum sp. WCF-2]QEH70651.1 adenosylcobinamide-GDP ribazoletransferase [Cellulosilyticum sp. WCF-2]
MKRLIGIMQFMTRLPIPVDTGIDEEFHKSMIYFPVVGLVLGLFYYAMGIVSQEVFNTYIATIIILIGEVILTGGLHLDGLGDTFDGLYSYRDKERMLEIMKDSRLGTNALLAILLVLLLKAGFIYTLLEQGLLWVILLMPVVARSMQVIACYKTKTPREKGMGNLFIGKVSTPYLIGTILIMLGIIGIVIFIVGELTLSSILMQLGSVLLLIIAVRLFVRSIYKKIDGITGDILGCICELAELGYLVLIYVTYISF